MRRISRFVGVMGAALLLTLLVTRPALAETVRFSNCLGGCPLGAPDTNHVIARSIYTLSFNTEKRIADWVTYVVTAESIGVATNLPRLATPDPAVSDTLNPQDFSSNGEGNRLLLDYFTPLVSFAGTPYWPETNYLSNRVPRNSELNRGSWYGLEWAVRNLANRTDGLYVITGPIYEAPDLSQEQKAETAVPSAFFKVVSDASGQAAAFIFPQDLPFHVHHCEQLSTIVEVEQLTGLDLFPELPQIPVADLSEKLGCFRQ
ncbi:MAG: DNA/RNA non-specific endonuclease [Gammaproteobacteria bacterium]|nr:DNA/RNA non-specific endonuclease [Pseudomonadales bacterium]